MLSSFSLDKAESSPPSVHYYITNLLPTYCRNSKNPAHFYLFGIFVAYFVIIVTNSLCHFPKNSFDFVKIRNGILSKLFFYEVGS